MFTQNLRHVRDLSLFEGDFEKLLLEAVDEGLASLGESPKKAIYYHLERSFNIKREEIPSRIIAFTCAIESIARAKLEPVSLSF